MSDYNNVRSVPSHRISRVPSHWSVQRVKHLGTYINGYPFAPSDWTDDGLPIIRIQNLTSPQAPYNFSSVAVPEDVRISNGDVLISWSASLGVYVWDRGNALLNQHIFKAIPADGIDPVFFAWVMRWAISELADSAHGSTMQHLTRDAFGSFYVPVPTVHEQHAIASYLDAETARIDGLIEEKRRLLLTLKDLQHTTISEILTGADRATVETGDVWLPRLPVDWSLKRLKHLGQVRSGLAKGKKHESGTVTTELPYMRVANVQDGHLDLSDVANIEVAIGDVERFSLVADDVLMNEGGDYDKLGRGAVWTGQISPCLHQNHVFAVRLDDPTWAPWVAALTRAAYAKFYFMNNSKQSTNLASISQTNVKELPVALPPMSDRDDLLATLNEDLGRISALSGHVDEELTRLADLRSATVTDAVLGRIDVREHIKSHCEPVESVA